MCYNIYTIVLQLINSRFLNVSNSKKKLSTFVGGFLRLYTRCLCILIRDSCFFAWGSCWELLGTRWEKSMFSIDLTLCCRLTYYHPHTQHTHTHYIWCVVFRCPGGGNECRRVCVLLQRAFTNDKACLFNIASHFRYSNHDVNI